MDADEKLLALRKAYADIILNISKEAAERVMISEKKALQFQYELSVAKQEALQMMLRLKKMMDFKNSEAEMASRSQHLRIEELEAQLDEAEGIVSDLREELRHVKAKLENFRNFKKQYMNEPDAAIIVETSENKGLNSCQSTVSILPESQCEPFASSDMKTLNLSQRIVKCCKERVHMRNSYGNTLEMPSIILRRKRHKSCRNGCTQRVHSCESNGVSDLSLSGKLHHADNEGQIEGDEKDKDIHSALADEGENMCNIEKNEVMLADNRHSSSYEIEGDNSFCEKLNAGISSRIHRTSSGTQPMKMIQTLGIYHQNTDKTEPKEIPTRQIVEMGLQPDCCGTNGGCVQHFDVKTKSSKEEDSIDILTTARQDGRCTKKFVPPNDKTNLVKIGEPVVRSKFKASKRPKVIVSQPMNTKVIKYTFQRKRKRAAVDNSESSISLENTTLKTMTEENCDNLLETAKLV